MRESLREERTLWVTDQIAQDNFPEVLDAFYLLKNPPAEEKTPADEEGGGKKGKVNRKQNAGTRQYLRGKDESFSSTAPSAPFTNRCGYAFPPLPRR